jgi:hypothetical protein
MRCVVLHQAVFKNHALLLCHKPNTSNGLAFIEMKSCNAAPLRRSLVSAYAAAAAAADAAVQLLAGWVLLVW